MALSPVLAPSMAAMPVILNPRIIEMEIEMKIEMEIEMEMGVISGRSGGVRAHLIIIPRHGNYLILIIFTTISLTYT